jgi:hypothetical protein
MAGHLLGVLQPVVVFQVNGDAGCSPGVTSDGGEKARRFGPLPDRSPGVVAVQSTSRHLHSGREPASAVMLIQSVVGSFSTSFSLPFEAREPSLGPLMS